jgi:hypothetical protein
MAEKMIAFLGTAFYEQIQQKADFRISKASVCFCTVLMDAVGFSGLQTCNFVCSVESVVVFFFFVSRLYFCQTLHVP